MKSSMKQKHSMLFLLAIACSTVSSLSLLAAIMVNNEGKNKALLVTFAILFWLGLVLEQIFFWNANKLMKKSVAKEKMRRYGKVGIISLPTSVEAMALAVLFIVSLLVLIVCMIFGLGENVLQYILICLIVLSFRWYCFLNGKNYKYKKTKER